MQAPHFFGTFLSVAQALDRQCNNFDLFRLLAALTVIYGHSFALAPAHRHRKENGGSVLQFEFRPKG